MQPCDELKNLVLRHYGKFDTGEQSDTIQEIYSLQEGVVIIGNGPEEWFDDRDSILTFMRMGSSIQREIKVLNIKACFEGTVGWTMDRVMVKFPGGVDIPIHHTRIFHREDGTWKMVHLNVSVEVPDEKMELLYS